jgi:hypothetical protein
VSIKVTRHDSKIAGRFYQVGEHRYPSVTHILSAINKPALVNWAANTERAAVSEAAADLFETWTSAGVLHTPMPRSWFLSELAERLQGVKAHQKALAAAGDIGTQVHQKIEWTMKQQLGVLVGPEPTLNDAAEWAFMAFESWAYTVSLKPVMVETALYSTVHGYAGTMDLLAYVDGVLTLGDYKTGKAIYPESFLQSAAYQVALAEMGHPVPTQALILRLPKVETDPAFEVGLVPPVDELFPVFLATKRLWEWTYQNEAAYRERRARG